MDFGWKVLIPLSLGWFLLLASLREFSEDGNVGIVDASSGNVASVALGAVVPGAGAYALITSAVLTARRARQVEEV